MNKYALLILLISIGWIHTDYLYAEPKKPQNTEINLGTPQAREQNQKVAFDESPFDTTRESFLPNYIGHDAKLIWEKLYDRVNNTKGEFETTEEYNKRLATALSQPVFNRLTVNDLYGVSLKPSFTYDADNKTVTLRVPNPIVKKGWDKATGKIGVEIGELSNTSSNYIGSNAYGATTEATNVSSDILILALNNKCDAFDWTSRCNMYGDIKITINNLLPEEAKKSKDNIRVLFVCRLLEPWADKGFYYSGATYDSPISIHKTYLNLHASAIAVWVYNLSTGIVLKKIQL